MAEANIAVVGYKDEDLAAAKAALPGATFERAGAGASEDPYRYRATHGGETGPWAESGALAILALHTQLSP